MNKIRVAVVGCGFIGKCHLKAIAGLDGAKVAAIADINEPVAREVATQFDIPAVYSNLDEVLGSAAVDAVVLALPAAGRAGLAIRALKAGKHVLLEKPTAMNSGEIKQLIAARGDLVCACCSARYRFTRAARVAADFVTGGTLGELQMLRCRAVHEIGPPPEKPPPRWRVSRTLNGGGILVNWGTYDLDFLLGVTGWSFAPTEVLAQTWRVAPHLASRVAPDSDAESHFAALIRCERGRCITLERGEFLAAAGEDAWQIIGSRGSLRIDMAPVGGRWAVMHDLAVPENGLHSNKLWTTPEAEFALDHQAAMDGPTEDFIAAIHEKRPPRTSLEQALIITTITDAIYASAQDGGTARTSHWPTGGREDANKRERR